MKTMKRVLTIFMVMIMVMSMSVAAFAAPDDFVVSPPSQIVPDVEEFNPVDDDCSAILVVTPFGDKEDLNEEMADELNNAYKDIINTENLGDLCDDLVDDEKLKVSDLFFVSTDGCADHDDHKHFEVILKDNDLKNFEGLMYRDNNGKWVLVENVKIDGNKLIFTLEDFDGSAPFAIVVDGEASSTTGDIDHTYIYLAIMAVSALALAVIVIVSKKKAA
jgi:hypothetical protein